MNLFDPVRQCVVPDLPEERVRQRLLREMIFNLGFPKSLIAVEKELSRLPHLANEKSVINRRADIICFAGDIHPEFSLYPLLMIECKAIPLSKKAVDQVLGYNYFVKAPFTAIANLEQIKTFWFDRTKKYRSVDFLPEYEQLMKCIK